MTELKPCPFCGGLAQIQSYPLGFDEESASIYYHFVECQVCFCRTDSHSTEQQAKTAWENRKEATK